MPENLFGNELIMSIGFNQERMLNDIIELHCKTPIELDPTFSKGGFYTGAIPRPKYCFDIKPRYDFVAKADFRKLPLEKESINTMMFDPPFMSPGYNSNHLGKMVKRFRGIGIENMGRLWRSYHAAFKEFHRIMKKRGVLIVKCQDVVDGRYNWFSHVEICNIAYKRGFYPKDLFILLSRARMTNIDSQVHARKHHSYFWVFEKKPSYVKYNKSGTYHYNEMPGKRGRRKSRKTNK